MYYVLYIVYELNNNNKCLSTQRSCILFLPARRHALFTWSVEEWLPSAAGSLKVAVYCCTAPDGGWLYFTACLLHIQLERLLDLAVQK